MVKCVIDGLEIEVEPGTTILNAARSACIEIPTFCYQDRLSISASCRMCLVEIEGRNKLEPSCATAVAEDMVVHSHSDKVVGTREDMLEILLANHPLDCPICDKGGECELQDTVFEYGRGDSRLRDPKRVFRIRDIDLNDVIVFNANRCIQCQRCVRMCEEIVGEVALGTGERGLDSEITGVGNSLKDCSHCGNCIEVCPVGALMSIPYRYKARPWDLVKTETICGICGTGCSLTVETRDGEFKRVKSRYDTGLNGELLCAKGRFGTDAFDAGIRVTEPLIRKDGKLTPVPLEQAVDYVARTAAHIRRNDGHVQGLISARQTNETAFFFQKLMRETFRSGDIHSSSRFPGLRDNQAVDALMQILSAPENRRPLKAALASEVVFLLGANVTEENPVTGFLIREAVRDQDKQLLVTSSRPSGLDDIAHASLRLLPGNEAVLLSALCGDMAQAAPNGMADFISASHASLDKAGSITLIVGSEFLRSSLAAGCLQWILRATDIWKAGGKEVCVHVLTDRANQRGLWEMGALPGAGPGGQPDPALSPPSNAVPDMVYILGADPVDGSPDDNPYRLAALETPCLVVQSSHMTRTAEMAHVVLPAPTYGEESGTYTNNEGLKQRVRIFRASPGVRTCQETLGLIATATETALRSGHAGPVEARFSAVADIPSTGIADFHPTVPNMGGKAGLDSPQVISDRRSGLTRYLVTGDGQFHSGNLLSQSRVLSSIRNGPYVEVNPGEDFNFETDGQMVSLVRGEARFTGRLKVNRAFDEDIVFVPECYLAGSAGNILSFAEYPLRVRLEFS